MRSEEFAPGYDLPGGLTSRPTRLPTAIRDFCPKPGICRIHGETFVVLVGNWPAGPAETWSHEMTRYLISFNDGAMTFPEEELPEVAKAARAVVEEAKHAGVFVFAGGLGDPGQASVVATDGTITNGPNPEIKDFIGGFTVVDVPTRDAALQWAAKIAVACRCAQEVREFLSHPSR